MCCVQPNNSHLPSSAKWIQMIGHEISHYRCSWWLNYWLVRTMIGLVGLNLESQEI